MCIPSVQSSFAHPFPPSRQRWGVASRCQALRIGIGSLLLLAAAGLDCLLPPAPVASRSAAVDNPHFVPKHPAETSFLYSVTSDISCTPAHTLTETPPELSRRPLRPLHHETLPRQPRRLRQPPPVHKCVLKGPGGLRSCARDMTNYSTFSDGNETGSEGGAMARYVPTMIAVTSQAHKFVLLSAALLALADAWESCTTLRRIPSPTLYHSQHTPLSS